MFHKIHFSITEAREILPEVKSALAEITTLKKSLDEKGYNIYKHHYFGGAGANGSGRFPADMERLVTLFHEISEKGIIVKGIDNGLIDFPHLRSNGEEVYLCYLLGEDDINFWHSIQDGFAGRRNIDEL